MSRVKGSMIAVLHVAFLWAVGISNVKLLLTSLVPWYVSAREECYRYVMLMLDRKKFWIKQFFLLQRRLRSFIAELSTYSRVLRSITLPSQYPRQISRTFFYSDQVNVHWSRPQWKSSSSTCTCNSLSYSYLSRRHMNTLPAVQALEPHWSETKTQML
jgi:hypothetical protein